MQSWFAIVAINVCHATPKITCLEEFYRGPRNFLAIRGVPLKENGDLLRVIGATSCSSGRVIWSFLEPQLQIAPPQARLDYNPQ